MKYTREVLLKWIGWSCDNKLKAQEETDGTAVNFKGDGGGHVGGVGSGSVSGSVGNLSQACSMEMNESVNWESNKMNGKHPAITFINLEADGSIAGSVPNISTLDIEYAMAHNRHRRGSTGNASNVSSRTGIRKGMSIPALLARQQFSQQQRQTLAQYSSLNYSPVYSHVYKDWLQRQKQNRAGLDKWFLMILSGLAIGFIAALLKQCLTALANLKWERTIEFCQQNDLMKAYGWTAGISTILVIISSVAVTFVYPPATGSGVPETISYLNGIVVYGSFGLKHLVVKFIALVFAVSSGLPCAIQGPVISMGGNIGNGISQFKSKTLGINSKYFTRFRNPASRRTFTTAGVAAGVAAAFNAPIGGLLFAMEDLASFWNKKLCWQTFFCCGIATATANLINSAFSGFKYGGIFGNFSLEIALPIETSILLFVPCMVLGVVGGILAAGFTHLNVFIVGLRKSIISRVSNVTAQKFCRILETVFLAVIMASMAIWLPTLFPCRILHDYNNTMSKCEIKPPDNFQPEPFNCEFHPPEGTKPDDTVYNEIATLLMQSGTSLFDMLITRYESRRFTWVGLLAVFPIWYFMTAWTAGSAIAGGIFIPTLVSGALYGRAAGLGMLELYTYLSDHPIPDSPYFNWLDPGLIAVIGASSLLAGVQRLTLAITVIMVEMSRDINVVIPLIVANFVAKCFADLLSKPLYKYQLESKALPYLDSELVVSLENQLPNLDLYTAADVMQTNVQVIRVIESIATLARMLQETDHSAFPVIKYCDETRNEVYYGLLPRLDLEVILSNEQVYGIDKRGAVITPDIDYEELSVDYIADKSKTYERIRTYAKFEQYQSIFVNLGPFINLAAPKIDMDYSLARAYSLFRTLGLRHLVVTDIYNKVVGVMTRKDLLPFNVAERIGQIAISERIRSAAEMTLGEGDPKAVPEIHVDKPEVGSDDAVLNYLGFDRRLSVARTETPL